MSVTWTPSTDGKHALTAVATYANGVSVTSHVVDVYSGTLSVTAGGWEPDNAIVGQQTYGAVNGTVSGGLDSDGSGPFFTTYHWETASVPSGSGSALDVWESDNGDATDSDGDAAIPFSLYSGSAVIGWPDGWPKTQFNATFWDAGYYIMVVKCVGTVHDSRTGAAVGSLVGYGYIGGSASDLPGGAPAPNAMVAHRLSAAATLPLTAPSPKGKKVVATTLELHFRTVEVGPKQYWHAFLIITDGTQKYDLAMGPRPGTHDNAYMYDGLWGPGSYDNIPTQLRTPWILAAGLPGSAAHYNSRISAIGGMMIRYGPLKYYADLYNSNSFMYTLITKFATPPGRIVTGHIPTIPETNAAFLPQGGGRAPDWTQIYPEFH